MSAREPIEVMMDGVAWEELPPPVLGGDPPDGVPYATHAGTLRFGDAKLRCYQLNDGRRIFDARDIGEFFAGSAFGADPVDDATGRGRR